MGTLTGEARASVPKPNTVDERRDAPGLILQSGTCYDKRMVILLGFFALAAFSPFGSFFDTSSPGPSTSLVTFLGLGLTMLLLVTLAALPCC